MDPPDAVNKEWVVTVSQAPKFGMQLKPQTPVRPGGQSHVRAEARRRGSQSRLPSAHGLLFLGEACANMGLAYFTFLCSKIIFFFSLVQRLAL